ncbi:PROTEIN RALF-LIKE 34 [Salix koriyanagi]|uniref:PROTEIN RALF-LIKE 34 n=2 Tax=Salix koriyanagi TaxID=2511006 RepID=A0A9Q0UMW7_9ROSI|nr:PROTEIN RALF-LIKE 34 [Salix koriyanagi]
MSPQPHHRPPSPTQELKNNKPAIIGSSALCSYFHFHCLCFPLMASSTLRYYFTFTIFLSAIFLAISPRIQAQGAGTSLEAMSDALEWPMSMYFDESSELDDGLVGFEDGEESSRSRSLLWRRTHYYISYGALSADRIPCPARSGRSYYSHNCFKSKIPVNPYSRGCSRITRCRR